MFARVLKELKEIYAAMKDDTPRCIGCGRCGAALPSKDGGRSKDFVCIMKKNTKVVKFPLAKPLYI